MDDGHTGQDGRNAQPDVGDDEKRREHPGSLIGVGQGSGQTDAALEAGTEADACRGGSVMGRRVWAGTSICGMSDRQAPNARGLVSGSRERPKACTTKTPPMTSGPARNSTPETRRS
jgi:hypothetical protein